MTTTASDNRRDALRRWIWLAVLAVAFAWVESAVVVYLRKIYFDGGFSFPLKITWQDGRHVIDPLVRIEFVREIATILMLVAGGCLAGRTPFQKFCYFMIAFGLWDIFYYVWLYVMVGWPPGLMTWDLLFYVPLPWVGPVLTPILIAMAMIAAGSIIVYYQETGYRVHWRWYDLAVELGCGLLLIVAFCWDWKNVMQLPGDVTRTGLPNPFAWWLYVPALLLAVIYFTVRFKRVVRLPEE